MPKKRKRVKAARSAPLPRKKHLSRAAVVGVCCALAISVAGGALSHWGGGGRIAALTSGFVQATPTPLTLSKEYVYAGGRLVATEEPALAPTSAGPTNLVATATQPTQVSLVWSAPASGTVDHYVVERAQSVSGPYSQLSPDPTPAGFTDNTAASGAAYLYRIKAVFAGGASSSYSNTDLATTMIFTDDPLTAGVTMIKAQHLDELRQAVNAVRALANLQPASWTDPSLSGVAIKSAHLQELRTNLDQALSALGVVTSPYTDPSLASAFIKKVHIEELRARVK
jgi:hypothetical protein